MQVNHTMTQLMTERETLRAEVERQDREIERLRAALREIVEYEKKFGIRDEGDGQALVSRARFALYGKS